jgi:hypothetical protein
MAVIIFALTQVLKLPIKACTKHIKKERVRRMVNATILLIPFAVGVVLDFVYSTYYLHGAFSVINGLGYGTAGISLYGAIERFFKVKTENPYETQAGKAVTELVEDISKDGKVDEKDKHAVKDFWDKVK